MQALLHDHQILATRLVEVILPDTLLIATVLYRSKNSFRDKSAWKHICAWSHALLRFCFVLIGVSGEWKMERKGECT